MTIATPIEEDVPSVPEDAEHFRNDIGYSDAFSARHRSRLRFVTNENCWLVFRPETGWTRDVTGTAVRALAADYARELYAAALNSAKDVEAAAGIALVKAATALGNRSRIEPMLSFAQCNPSVAVGSDQLDKDPFLLGTQNGFVDLTTGQFYPHTEERLITRRLSVAFNASATATVFEKFLAEVQPDEEVRAFLQRWAGYCLTAAIREHVLLFHYGTGSNGKSIFLEHALLRMTGDYGVKLSDSLIYANERGNQPHLEIAGLCGKRLAVGEEKATDEAEGFYDMMNRIRISNMGSVFQFRSSDLEKNVETISQARDANLKVLQGQASGRWGQNYFKGAKEVIGNAMADVGAALTESQGSIETMSSAEREVALKQALVQAVERLVEKQKEAFQWEQMRLKGAEEVAAYKKKEAEYDEAISEARRQDVSLGDQNLTRSKQLQAEKDAQLAALQDKIDSAERIRVTNERISALGTRDANLNKVSGATTEQRRANKLSEERAMADLSNLRQTAESRPGDPDLAAQVYIAEQTLLKIKAENAKWERNRVMSGRRIASASELRSQERQEDVNARQAGRIAERITESSGRISARVGNSPEAGKILGARSRIDALNARIGDDGILASAFRRDAAPTIESFGGTNAGDWGATFKQSQWAGTGQSNASAEMQHKGRMADIGMTRAERQDALNKQKQDRIESGNGKLEESVATAARILTEWNKP